MWQDFVARAFLEENVSAFPNPGFIRAHPWFNIRSFLIEGGRKRF
jgi:hypothetical protein